VKSQFSLSKSRGVSKGELRRFEHPSRKLENLPKIGEKIVKNGKIRF